VPFDFIEDLCRFFDIAVARREPQPT
jgi:hypothetical protein